jgi:hypothetical protein
MAAAAEATDAGEDDLFGPDRRGDEVPDDLADPSTRSERIQALLRRAEADKAERDAAAAEKDKTALVPCESSRDMECDMKWCLMRRSSAIAAG